MKQASFNEWPSLKNGNNIDAVLNLLPTCVSNFDKGKNKEYLTYIRYFSKFRLVYSMTLYYQYGCMMPNIDMCIDLDILLY